MWACRNGFEEIVITLLQNEAAVNQANRFGSTALMWAASRGHSNICKILIDNGAEVNKANKVCLLDIFTFYIIIAFPSFQ